MDDVTKTEFLLAIWYDEKKKKKKRRGFHDNFHKETVPCRVSKNWRRDLPPYTAAEHICMRKLRTSSVVHALNLIPSFVLRCLSLLLWISRLRAKKKGPQIHKRYVDDNLLQLLILKLFVGSFTKCSSQVPQWPPLLIMELDVAFWHTKFTFGSPVSILFSKLDNSQLFRNCVALTHRNFDGYFYRKKCVLYTGKYGSKPLDTLCCWFMLVFFNLLLGLLQD